MTQPLSQQEAEDRATLRRLGAVIGTFIVATAILAISVGIVMG